MGGGTHSTVASTSRTVVSPSQIVVRIAATLVDHNTAGTVVSNIQTLVGIASSTASSTVSGISQIVGKIAGTLVGNTGSTVVGSEHLEGLLRSPAGGGRMDTIPMRSLVNRAGSNPTCGLIWQRNLAGMLAAVAPAGPAASQPGP